MGEMQTVTSVLSKDGPWGLLALALLAIAWMYRDARAREAAHLQTATQIAVLAEKLADGVKALERISDRLTRKRDTPT